MNDLVSAIQTVGFNAVFLLVMAYFLKYMFDRLQNTIDDFTSAIRENTVAITKMSEKIKNHFNEEGDNE